MSNSANRNREFLEEQKLKAEISKANAERQKLNAERRKIESDRGVTRFWYLPFLNIQWWASFSAILVTIAAGYLAYKGKFFDSENHRLEGDRQMLHAEILTFSIKLDSLHKENENLAILTRHLNDTVKRQNNLLSAYHDSVSKMKKDEGEIKRQISAATSVRDTLIRINGEQADSIDAQRKRLEKLRQDVEEARRASRNANQSIDEKVAWEHRLTQNYMDSLRVARDTIRAYQKRCGLVGIVVH